MSAYAYQKALPLVPAEGSQHQAAELFDLASELEDEAFDMLEAVTRLDETLTALRLESLDDNSDDDEDA